MRARRICVVVGIVACTLCAQATAAADATPSALSLDKAAQRRLALRTLPAQAAPERLYAARALPDPARRWLAAADQAGWIEAPEGGFPQAGQSVRAGQLLAWLRPAMSAAERADLRSEQAGANSELGLAELQIRRFNIEDAEHIDIQLPTPSIQIIADYRGAQARTGVLGGTLRDRVAIKAPADGLLQASLARSLAVSQAGEPLFAGAPADAMMVEVVIADDDLGIAVDDDARAFTADGRSFALKQVAGQIDPATRARRLRYRIDGDGDVDGDGVALQANEPLQLALRATDAAPRLPRASLFRAGDGWQVWIHESSERFVARPVQARIDGSDRVAIEAGLQPGDRVVADASALLRARP